MVKYNPPTEDHRNAWFETKGIPLEKEIASYDKAYRRRCYEEMISIATADELLSTNDEPDQIHETLLSLISGSDEISPDAKKYRMVRKKLEDVGLVTSDSSAEDVFECLNNILDGNMDAVSNQSQIRYLSSNGVYDQNIIDNDETLKTPQVK